jgi:hypothetical protein
VGATVASLASAAAGICCIGPLALTLLGVQGAILAAGIKPYRGYLLGASFLFLAVGHWGVHRRNRITEEGASCSVRTGRWTKRVLWAATFLFVVAVVIQVVADRYWP